MRKLFLDTNVILDYVTRRENCEYMDMLIQLSLDQGIYVVHIATGLVKKIVNIRPFSWRYNSSWVLVWVYERKSNALIICNIRESGEGGLCERDVWTLQKDGKDAACFGK